MAKGIYAGVTKTLGDYAEGDIIQLNESGSPVDFYVAKHNYESSLNGAGRTLLVRRYPYATIAWDDNRKNAYATSTSDAWLNSTYKSQLDENVRNALGVTSFYYTPGNGDNTVGTLSRAVFMLSMTEIGIKATGSFNTEGTKITSCMLKSVSLPGSADNVPQWSRTPSITQLGYAFNEISGVQNPSNTMSASPYVRPAFTLPSTFEMIPDKARKVKKMYVGVENFTPMELPSGFTQLAFIGSTGTQYIDTGVMPNQDTRAVCDAQLTAVSGTVSFLGQRYTSATQAFGWISVNGSLRSYYNAQFTVVATADTARHLYDKDKNVTRIDGETVHTADYAAFDGDFPLYLFAGNEQGTAGLFAQARLYACKIYASGVLIRDFVPCRRHSDGAAGLYDMITGAFYGNSGTGSFEEGPSEHKSTARKVKKAYVGVGGVARPCYTGGELAYYGTATPLSIKGYNMAATTVGNYALFGGRHSSPNLSEYNAAVDAYDTALVRTTATPFSHGQMYRSATTVEGYALFGGGRSSVNGMLVDAYDISLVRTAPASLHIAKAWVAAGTVGNHAIFAGGSDNNESYTYTKVAEAYDASLTKTTIASLSVVRYNIDVPTVGNYALFAGGYMDHVTSVDAYNASLTRTNAPELDIGRNANGAATVGNYALIGGGLGYTTYAPSVNAYDASLTKTMAPQLSYSVTNLSATAIGEFALFGGGNGTISVSESGHSDTVDVYDASLTKITTTPLSEARTLLAAVTIGNYALFAGGQGQDSGGSTVVDVYTIS